MEELETMRLQLAELKRQLDTQQILNNELLRKIMRRKASWLNKFVLIEFISLPISYILFAALSAAANVSQWYAFIFLIFGTLDTICDCRTVRIPPRKFSEASLIQLRAFLVRQKRERMIQLVISAPLTLIWLLAYGYALFGQFTSTIPADDSLIRQASAIGLIGGGIGAVCGVIVVIILYRKIERTNHSLMGDISDLEQAE